MATGFSFRPLVKQVPLNGAEVPIDLQTAFTDTRGAKAIGIDYEQELEERKDINRRKRPLRFGWRMTIDLLFWIKQDTQHPNFVDMTNRLQDEEWVTSISLDGGTTYVEVWGKKAKGPGKIRDKWFVGVEERITLESVDLLPERPYLSPAIADPLIAEPYAPLLPPSLAMRGAMRYVRAQNGAPGYFMLYGEKGSGLPDAQPFFDFGP